MSFKKKDRFLMYFEVIHLPDMDVEGSIGTEAL